MAPRSSSSRPSMAARVQRVCAPRILRIFLRLPVRARWACAAQLPLIAGQLWIADGQSSGAAPGVRDTGFPPRAAPAVRSPRLTPPSSALSKPDADVAQAALGSHRRLSVFLASSNLSTSRHPLNHPATAHYTSLMRPPPDRARPLRRRSILQRQPPGGRRSCRTWRAGGRRRHSRPRRSRPMEQFSEVASSPVASSNWLTSDADRGDSGWRRPRRSADRDPPHRCGRRVGRRARHTHTRVRMLKHGV